MKSTLPAPLKTCFVISSIGGPRMLNPLFSGTLKPDVAYVIVQRLAGPGMLDVLVECLREELNIKTFVAGHSLELQGGAIHFLPNERHYTFKGNKLSAIELSGKTQLSLDHLFKSAMEFSHLCSVVVLSGMLTDEDSMAGLAQLKASGVQILGTLENQTPVFDMIEQLDQRGLMGDLHPTKHILEHVRFGVEAKGGSNGQDKSLDGSKILVVDDDEKVRCVIVEMLRMQGFTVDVAVDGLDALRKLQKGKYGLLILDLHMPEMDGIKTLEALKTIAPTLPIVVMTGSNDPAKVQAAKEFNVLGVLQKPFGWEKLKKILPYPGTDTADSKKALPKN